MMSLPGLEEFIWSGLYISMPRVSYNEKHFWRDRSKDAIDAADKLCSCIFL